MGSVDGRGLAVGIAVGVIVGLGVWALTSNAVWIGVIAGVGAVIGMNTGLGGKDS